LTGAHYRTGAPASGGVAVAAECEYIGIVRAVAARGGGVMLNILVVEDHALVREGLTRILGQVADEGVTLHEAGDVDAALSVLDAHPEIDLVTLDLALPGVDGLTWLAAQRKRFPTVPFVVVSAYDDESTVRRVMRAGAAGFVSKSYPAEAMLAALRSVLAGEVVQPFSVRPPLGIDAPTPPAISTRAKDLGLSPRQAEVLALMAKGQSNRHIAQVLGLTEGTVKIHVTAIFRALGVSSRTQALVALSRHKIKL
jgi:DNA-binding NarL/FixJ family response regulator